MLELLRWPVILYLLLFAGIVWLLFKEKLGFQQASRAFAGSFFLLLCAYVAAQTETARLYGPTIGFAAVTYGCVMLLLGWVAHPPSKVPASLPVAAPYSKPLEPISLGRNPTGPIEHPLAITPAELYDGKIILVTGSIDGFTANAFAHNCHAAIAEKAERVTVQVSTQGGIIDYAWSMFENLRLMAEIVDTRILVVGPCKSAGVSLIMAVSRERRFATRKSEFMIHSALSTDGQGKVIDCPGPENRARIDHYNQNWVTGLLANNTHINGDDLATLLESGQCAWLSAQEALELGIVGGIV